MIEEGNRVKIINVQMANYRKKEIGEFIDKIGTVTNINMAYQSLTMYNVMFSLNPFIQESFFEDEVKKI